MPKKTIDYFKCCIFKIEYIEDENLLYVGHTTEFNKRKSRHKHNCGNEKNDNYNIKLYTMISENDGWDMF
jgi:predicted GIY-YIG superfamily endonuclease